MSDMDKIVKAFEANEQTEIQQDLLIFMRIVNRECDQLKDHRAIGFYDGYKAGFDAALEEEINLRRGNKCR